MGMLVNIRLMFSPEILLFGLTYTVGAIVAKVVGSGLPALFLGFNRIGALRTGLGMVPRGEVVLIIAGIGLSYGFLDHSTFSIPILMIFVTTLVGPLLLNITLSVKSRGTRKEVIIGETVPTLFNFSTPELTDLVEPQILANFAREGYFVHRVKSPSRMYHIQKEESVVLLTKHPHSIQLDTSENEVVFVKTIVYETLLTLHEIINKVKDLAKPESLRRDIAAAPDSSLKMDIGRVLQTSCIILEMKAENKHDAISELVDLVDKKCHIADKNSALQAVLDREKTMSTGMQYGLAIPHARVDEVKSITVAIGIKKSGIDFQALDNQPSRVFVLILSPVLEQSPHIQVLAAIVSSLNKQEKVDRLLACRNKREVFRFFQPGETSKIGNGVFRRRSARK
jgi:fructose-specific phosphotransferase system IIA component